MNSKRALFLLGISAIFVLTSCSGLKSSVCTVNCGGSGNASLTISLYDTPPTGTNVLSFTLPIVGVSLTPSSGSPPSVTTVTSSVEVTRLQSDSTVIVHQASVPAADYTAINMTLGPTSSTNNLFINTSGSTITYGTHSCVNGAICALPVGAVYTISIPLTLNLSANQSQWIGLDFNLNKAITTSGGISVDFTQTGVLTATTTAPLGITSGNVANIDDFSGLVTASAGNSITVKSGTRGTLTAAITSSTTFNDPQNLCTGSSSVASCITTNLNKAVVSVQATLSSAGAIDATEIDVLDTSGTDSIEGFIYPSSCNGGSNLGLILADSAVPSGNATLTGLSYGAGFCLTVSPTASFLVDTGFLPTGQLTAGFSNSSDIRAGQVVRVNVSNVVAGSVVDATATSLLLRYSRLSGTVNVVTGNNFTINGLPTYLGFTLSPLVATYPQNTIFEGVTGISGLSNSPPPAVAIRALYLNPTTAQQGIPFLATKVRLN